MKRTITVQIVSRAQCRDDIVRQLGDLELYLSAYLRSRVRIVSSCSCPGIQTMEVPEVYVDGRRLAQATLASVVDAVYRAALDADRPAAAGE